MFYTEEKSNSGSRDANLVRLGGLRKAKTQRYWLGKFRVNFYKILLLKENIEIT